MFVEVPVPTATDLGYITKPEIWVSVENVFCINTYVAVVPSDPLDCDNILFKSNV